VKSYSKGSHTVYHHRYHLVWITKYRYKVLRGELQRRVRTIVAQVAEEMGVKIINGVVSSDHIHLFVSIPPHVLVSKFVQRAKGRSSRKVQQEFPELRKRYWGRHFWGRGYFSATSGNVTDEIINEYINSHYDAHKHNDEESISLE
jgi:putative transposase